MKNNRSLSKQAARFVEYFQDNEKHNLKRGFQNLSGVTELNQLLDSPSDSYSLVHIAGSKGKGSTAYLISGILQGAGFKVGLFTSPHIHDIRERIQINRNIIDFHTYQEIIEEFSRRIDPGALKMSPSFFDLFTLVAFQYFKQEDCDFAVIETGLGGLFDSTNIVSPALSLITSLEWEHRGLLGNSIEEIAAHKCGIIKEGSPVLTGIKDPYLLSLVQKNAEKKGSPFYSVPHIVKLKKQSTSLKGTELILDEGDGETEIISPLIGYKQIDNILLALAAVKILVPSLEFKYMAESVSQIKLPGRFDIISQNPPVIHDVAHTGQSVRATMEILEQEGFNRGCLIFGCCADKELSLIASYLGSSLKDIFITTFDHIRCGDPDTILKVFQSFLKGKNVHLEVRSDANGIYKEVLLHRNKYDYILVMGSFFLLSRIYDPLSEDRVPRLDQF